MSIEWEDGMGEWQPIETAPKDGTRVLAVDENGRVDIMRYEPQLGGLWVLDDGPACEPTHWMPLPEPPASLPLEE